MLGHARSYDKTAFYSAFAVPRSDNLFSVSSSDGHAKMRRHISGAYTTSALLSYEEFVDNCNAILKEKFSGFAETGRQVDMREFFQFYAFDVIGEITVSLCQATPHGTKADM